MPCPTTKSKDPEPCPSCITGTIHEGLPVGTEQLIHGLNTYVVGNPAATRIIVIYSDIFGLNLPNNKIIADAYARSGDYLVYLVDFFKGDTAKISLADKFLPVDATTNSPFGKYTGLLMGLPSFAMWLTRHKHASADKECMEWLKQLRTAEADKKIGMVGFCWGGRYALRASRAANMIEVPGSNMQKPLVDAVVAFHPSSLDIPEDVEDPVVPTSIGWGKEDIAVKIESKDKVAAVHASGAAGRKMPEVEHRVWTPGRHGFAVRGNPDDPAERAILEGTEKQVLEWFGKYL